MVTSKKPYTKWSERPTPSRCYFKWTPEARAHLAQLAATMTDDAIAMELGCTRAAAHRARYQFGIVSQVDRRKVRSVQDDVVDQVRGLAGKATTAEIARGLGLKLSTVLYVRKEYGIHGSAKGQRGMNMEARWAMRNMRRDARAERMVALTEKIGAMRSWLQSVA
jgi:hypothetical protein